MFDVISVGSATVDAFVKTKDIKHLQGSGYYKKIISYPIGSKILIKKLNFTTGGGGTNTSVAFSRLGLKTALISKLGHDINAEIILHILKKNKVNTNLIIQKKGKTGYSVVLDAFGKDRTILTYRGSSDHIDPKEIQLKKLHPKWFYFSCLLEKSLKTQEKIARYANSKKIPVMYNPSSYIVGNGIPYLKKILKYVDVIIMNKQESQNLTKKRDIKEIIRTIHKAGPNIIIITDGKNRTFAFCNNKIYSFTPPKIKPKETTGAGDAFASGFLAGLIKRKDIHFALKLGLVNSRSVIMHKGAKNILLSYIEACKQIKKLKVKIKWEKFQIGGANNGKNFSC